MIYVLLIGIIAIILIVAMFKVATRQRQRELEQKIKHFDKKH